MDLYFKNLPWRMAVHLQWHGSGTCLQLRWREIGGPTVRATTRNGFGGRIIEQVITQLKDKRSWSGAGRGLSAKSPFRREALSCWASKNALANVIR